MKSYLFFFLICFLNCTYTSATIITSNADSNINVSAFKQSKQFFLDKYGTDDTTRALINYFFKHRKAAFLETVIPPVVGGVSAILLNSLLNASDNNNQKGASGTIVVIIPLILVIYAVPVYIIDGQIKWLIFNRRKLLTILESYNSGNSLPKKITRRKVFKLELEKLT